MGILQRLFGRNNKGEHGAKGTSPARSPVQRNSAPCAPGTRISYDARLVFRLTADHRRLLRLLVKLERAFDDGYLTTAVACLHEFGSEMRAHLLSEKVQLYLYLHHALKSDPFSVALLRALQQEMDAIGKHLVAFLAKYEKLAANPKLLVTFRADLGEIVKLLTTRIRREETTLFPLYAPF